MPRFNTPVRPVAPNTKNLAGGSAFKESAELELVGILLTSFVQNTHYQNADDSMTRVCVLIDALPDKRFASKAAVYARTVFGMRSISHVAAAHIAATVRGAAWTRAFFAAVCTRPDDVLEIMALYQAKYGKYPHALTEGLRAALMKFDAYQIGKYKGEGKTINMYDAVNYLHPKGEHFTALMTGKLETPDTWETGLTEAGEAEDKEVAKSEAWGSLIASGKIGQLALLRNLRNIVKQAPESIDAACTLLVDERRVRSAKIFPFQYFTAYEQLKDAPRKVTSALQDALDLAVVNVPKLEGRTAVVVDCSGSMNGKPITIASQFAAVLLKSNDCDLILFGSEAHQVRYNERDSLVTLSKAIQTAHLGGTNFEAAIEALGEGYTRVIILSDNESWQHQRDTVRVWREKWKGGAPHLYSWDMAGTGTLQFPEKQVYYLAGFSDKVFDVMGLLEHDREALLSIIRAV